MKGGLRLHQHNKASSAGQPLVTIITVVLNGEKHLEQAMYSVFTQSYPNIEYIIIDGGSNDGTLDLIKKHESSIDYWESAKDGGIFHAMNKGIALAGGEIIGLLNADDFYEENIVKDVVAAMIQNCAEIVYGNMAVVNEAGEKMSVERPDISLMNKKPSVFHPGCFVHKDAYKKAGIFDTRFKISSDYEFLLRCLRNNIRFSYLDKVIACFRPGGMSASCASNIEGYRIMKMHGTGYHREVIWRAVKCYIKTFFKKLLNLGGTT